MHALMILVALAIAFSLRLLSSILLSKGQRNWPKSLFFFLFPPLFLLMTAIAVIFMGYQGQMFGWQASWLSYCLAIIFTSIVIFNLIKLYYQAWRSQIRLRIYPQEIIAHQTARILNIDFPYSAQIGLWKPQLVVSKGLIDILDRDHLQAVLAHERAHYKHRDTFWFFWLGWVRSFTHWLPYTDTLWQEMLFLREMRADKTASLQVDVLLLAESLLLVAQKVNQASPFNLSESFCAAFNDNSLKNRLLERIDALLVEEKADLNFAWKGWLLLSLALLPLLTLPWHY